MNWTIVACALGLLMVPAVLARFDRLFVARTVIRLNRTAVTVGLLLLVSGLAVTAGPLMLRPTGLDRFGALCERMFEHVVAGGPLVGTLSGVAAAWILGAGLIGAAGVRRHFQWLRVDPGIGDRFEWRGISVIVLDAEEPAAYAVSGRDPQIVVTSGLWRRLTRGHKRALLAHELAHVVGRHARDVMMLGAVRAALGRLPGVARGAGFWREALELAADDDAAQLAGRRSVCDTVRDLALLQPAAALGIGGVGSIVRRIDYQSREGDPPARFAAGVWIGVLAMTGAAATSAFVWMAHAHAVVPGLMACPA